MKFIVHRINTIRALEKIPKKYGVEVDLRDYGNRLILQHDPFKDGEDFKEYLKEYDHNTIILNIKSEGIEFRVLELLKEFKIKNYFFLDCSFPMIYLLSEKGEKNIALRYSEYEKLDTIIKMKGRVNWVWVDCFSALPLDKNSFQSMKKNGFKLCLVSPELVGRIEDIIKYKQFFSDSNMFVDAICTKYEIITNWK